MDIVKNQKELQDGEAPPESAGIFGAILDKERAKLQIIPVPWDVTVSYGTGAATGPAGILQASHQLDLEDLCFGKPYLEGIHMLPIPEHIGAINDKTKDPIDKYRENGNPELLSQINENCDLMNAYVYETAKKLLKKDHLVAVVGGDHSSPFGLIKALAEKHEKFSILHVDAHFDLRLAYEGFTWSHASIMRNVMDRIPQVDQLTQVAIRDFSLPEKDYAESLGLKNKVFYGRDLFRKKARGTSFAEVVKEIASDLSEKVYISFDIDGLDPSYCPNTGTPVAGGLSFDEANYMIEELVTTFGKNVIGFDLCEVVHQEEVSEYDANVGARILYKLCGATLKS